TPRCPRWAAAAWAAWTSEEVRLLESDKERPGASRAFSRFTALSSAGHPAVVAGAHRGAFNFTATEMIMPTRRLVLAGLAASSVAPAFAQAPDWRQGIKEVRFGVSSAENEAGAIARTQPMVDYLSQRLGVPVRFFRVADYAGLVEAMRA